MSPDERLASIVREIKEAGIDVLVMGGHAVRFYGVDRNTSDFDLVTSVMTPSELRTKLPQCSLLSSIKEVPSWRSDDFARFEIGTLPNGRQEFLEFWLRNHLLPAFSTLQERAEVGAYGGDSICFLGLDDLIRSKETERESDWQDISLLEEIRDERYLGQAVDSARGVIAVQNVRSRRGFERLVASGLFNDANVVHQAIENCTHPVTFAMLHPLSRESTPKSLASPIDANVLKGLSKIDFQSTVHRGLVEIVRRSYMRSAMEIDRLDKEAKVQALRFDSEPKA